MQYDLCREIAAGKLVFRVLVFDSVAQQDLSGLAIEQTVFDTYFCFQSFNTDQRYGAVIHISHGDLADEDVLRTAQPTDFDG